MIIKDLIEINRRLSYDLWNVSCSNDIPTGLSPRLIFPVKRMSGKIRISEQEARILYCNILNNLNYFYSIETPTEKPFKQTSQTPLSGRSALSDLSIYIYNANNASTTQFDKVANVEFKLAIGPEEIRKDIEKIMTEQKDGNWVHILENINSKNLPLVFNRLSEAIKRHYNKGIEISIVFLICGIKKYKGGEKISLIRNLEFKNPLLIQNVNYYIEKFFCLDKNNNSSNIHRKSLSDQINILEKNGWMIVEQ